MHKITVSRNGHVQNIPWSGDGRYIVALRTTFQDRMPEAGEAADVVLINIPVSIRPDGTRLTAHNYIGGHPEWLDGTRVIGSSGDKMMVYDVDEKQIVETLPKEYEKTDDKED